LIHRTLRSWATVPEGSGGANWIPPNVNPRLRRRERREDPAPCPLHLHILQARGEQEGRALRNVLEEQREAKDLGVTRAKGQREG
jgi:hypothetical protein